MHLLYLLDLLDSSDKEEIYIFFWYVKYKYMLKCFHEEVLTAVQELPAIPWYCGSYHQTFGGHELILRIIIRSITSVLFDHFVVLSKTPLSTNFSVWSPALTTAIGIKSLKIIVGHKIFENLLESVKLFQSEAHKETIIRWEELRTIPQTGRYTSFHLLDNVTYNSSWVW